MKILKLLFALAIFSFIVVDSSSLFAADEPSTAATPDATSYAGTGMYDDGVVIDEAPQRKSFIRRLMFWKKDTTTDTTSGLPTDTTTTIDTNVDDITISEEDMDPALARERRKPLEIRVRDKYGIKVDTFRLFEANLKVLNQDALNKDTEFVMPLDDLEREMYVEEFYDRRAPIVMSRLDLKQSVDIYMGEHFSDFQQMARVKVIFRDVPVEEIKGYGAYIGANLIVMKRFFEPTIGQFVYDIVFLNGDVDNKALPWFRNEDEAENLSTTLKALNVTNLNDYMNIITHNMLNPNRSISQRLNENYQVEQDKQLEATSAAEEEARSVDSFQNQQRLAELAQRANEAQTRSGLLPSDAANFSEFLLTDMTEEELFELQRALVTFRVNAVVGLWEDVITGDVVEIRVLPKTATRTQLTYAAYSILGADLDTIVRFTTNSTTAAQQIQQTVDANGTVIENVVSNADAVNLEANPFAADNAVNNLSADDNAPTTSLDGFTDMMINKGLSWLSRDIKMEFSATSGSGFFMDNEKMINDAIVYFHPAKGLIVVALPNREFRYYKPIVPDMYPALEESLYNSRNVVATNVDQDNLARFQNELDSTPGTTNYFLYPGVTLGVISVFLLLFI
ncbi:MAG: hypothetical protein LBQ34_07215 [Alphaproteobacteria bacterium]|jgi:hypothetical protein|nr:hypothetical protein [Alphaproteobacteria bacterium]